MTQQPVEPAAAADKAGALEFTVRARTQGEIVRRRFFRHRGAMAGLSVFAFIVVLAFTSIGIGPIPGWWGQDYTTTGPVLDGGRPTLDLLPSFIDGDGMSIGEHPFGQDTIGRDYFALTMRGAQQSLIIALTIGTLTTLLGTTLGALAGYFRGRTETIIMRATDLMITIPLLVIAAVIGRTFGGQGIFFLAFFLSLVLWPTLTRLVRGEFLSLREKEFVEAARALGASSGRIIFRHILPNSIGTIIVAATLTIASAILLESALSFLGFGIQPPDTSLGLLISTYQNAFGTRPWLFWWPGIFIIAIALSINFVGDGLRDAFDPKQTRVRE
jgi:ABC-type dipeptide/oligopeptide/nickel transport system permease subunit